MEISQILIQELVTQVFTWIKSNQFAQLRWMYFTKCKSCFKKQKPFVHIIPTVISVFCTELQILGEGPQEKRQQEGLKASQAPRSVAGSWVGSWRDVAREWPFALGEVCESQELQYLTLKACPAHALISLFFPKLQVNVCCQATYVSSSQKGRAGWQPLSGR